MRALVQRVTNARVEVDGEVVGQIGPGICAFVGVTHADDEATADRLVDRLAGFRMLADAEGRMNRSLRDAVAALETVPLDAETLETVSTETLSTEPASAASTATAEAAGAAVLVVSQFTLYGSTSKGRRPGFTAAAEPSRAADLIERVVAGLRSEGLFVATGQFAAHMQVTLTNDGPVTFLLEVD